jgi:protease IV
MTPNTDQNIVIKPKIGGFLIAYILFSMPGFLIGLVSLLLLIILGIGAIAGSAAVNSNNSFQTLDLKSTNESNTENGILIYELAGAITSGNFTNPVGSEIVINVDKVKADFDKIKKNSNIKNVVFKVNTPGGEIYASEILGDLMVDLQKSKVNAAPNVYFDQLAASGGLWASYKAGSFIVGSPYGETGSVGVILRLPNFKNLSEKVGYSETVIKSTTSKDIGNPLREISEIEKDYFQQQVNTSFGKFKQLVIDNRKLTSGQVDAIATGLTFPNPEAKQKGLIDQVGDIEFLVTKAAREANIGTDYKVWTIEKKTNPLQDLLSAGSFANLLGLQGLENATKSLGLKSGQLYAIDELKI